MSQHVVVGAGPVGSAIARLLAERGEEVVVVTRSGTGPDHPGIRRVRGDAGSVEQLLAVSTGAAAIYNAANPAYHRWATDWPPVARALLTTAERSGAVLATVSNLYGYGPVDGPMTEDLPLAATGPKGRVRAQMWTDALAAHDAGRVRATEVRGSDYVCPGDQSQLGDRVVPPLLAGKKVSVMRSADAPHTWTSVQDVARLIVTVAADERGWGRPWHVPSTAPRTAREAITDLGRAAGRTSVAVGEYPAALIWALGLTNPTIRALGETAYQRERTFVMDSSAAQRTFGLAPTPWDDVVAAQVAHYRSRVTASA